MKEKKVKITGAERKQKKLFQKSRANVVLSKDEVKKIKIGRRELRKQMRAMGVVSKKEFELTASSLGLYFDKSKNLGLLLWLLSGRGLAVMIGGATAALMALYGFSAVTEMRGHFTISMSDELFKEGCKELRPEVCAVIGIYNIFKVKACSDNLLIINISQIHTIAELVLKWRIFRTRNRARGERVATARHSRVAIHLKRSICSTAERASSTLKEAG
jgi:hypothetical protein